MTKPVELRIAADVWDMLRAHHLPPSKRVETLSYLVGSIEQSEDAIRILVPATAAPLMFGPDCFARRAAGNVRLHPDVLRGLMIRFAGMHQDCLLNAHDHWFARRTQFSSIDNADDYGFDRYMRRFYEPSLRKIAGAVVRPIWNVALVLGQEGADARIVDTRQARVFTPVTRLTVVGDRSRTIPLGVKSPLPAAPQAVLSRHRDFVAPEHQAALRGLHAVLVGCGGTGSIAAETLGRIGIGELTLIDGDRLEDTNLNRWQGAEPSWVGDFKAERLALRLRAMFPQMNVRSRTCSVFDPVIEPLLRNADVLFGTLDADEPRIPNNVIST